MSASRLRLALAQLNVRVGDLAGNRQRILDALRRAREAEADVVLVPELAITGYPPEDLLLKPRFVEEAMRSLESVAEATRGMTAVVGGVWHERDLYNVAAVFHDGHLATLYRKQRLPNYGVFDENRYFAAGDEATVLRRGDAVLGVSICEDIWYPDGPAEAQATRGGAQVLLNISSSPYFAGKGRGRERMLATRAADNLAYVAYCNLVGGQDELVFDGQSLVLDPRGDVVARAPQFEEALLLVDIDPREAVRRRLHEPRGRANGGERLKAVDLAAPPTAPRAPLAGAVSPPLPRAAEVYQALVLGTRDYVRKNGFSKVVLGLSGGIDSALTAVIGADALGPQNVTGVAMPTRYSSDHSLKDAEELAHNLGIGFLTVPIDATFQSFMDTLAPAFRGAKPDLTEENLQPRIRGTMLMALSNKFGWLVLTTGNKSESAVGYSTLYGDTAGGFAVIKDVPKTLVYELARHRNAVAGRDLIPLRTIEKPPSAELRPDQKDTDSLPPYEVLDPILHAYVEESCSVGEIVARGFPEHVVRDVVAKVDRNEYKRRQSPPGVKITPRAFGKDWRLPITNGYRS